MASGNSGRSGGRGSVGARRAANRQGVRQRIRNSRTPF